MALDPNLGPSGGDIYLLYSRDAAHRPGAAASGTTSAAGPMAAARSPGRLVRITVGANGRATGPPVPIVENQWCAQFQSHSIGTVLVGPDQKLYVGAGDGASFVTAD